MRLLSKIWNRMEYFISLVLVLLILGTMFFLTNKQAWYATMGWTEAGYQSDILAYMQEVMGEDSGYNFPYPIMFLLMRALYKFFPIQTSVAITVSAFQGMSFLLLRYFFHKYISGKSENGLTGGKKIFLTVSAFFLLVYSMIFIYNHPFYGTSFYYLGVFSPNPFHNATYIAARPFNIISIFLFMDLLDTYEKEINIKKAICFSGMLLVSTMTKPSFTLVFCGTAGLIMLYRLLRARFSNLKNTLILGCMFLPTFVDLLYQFAGVFMGYDSRNQKAGIGIGLFRAWKEYWYSANYPLAIILMSFFPLLALIFQYRKLATKTLYRFGWQMYGVSLAMFIVFYEKGFRAVDANFSWGYMLGGFFLVMGSLLVLLEDTFQAEKHSWKLFVQWGAFGIHVICGMIYFLLILSGRPYY